MLTFERGEETRIEARYYVNGALVDPDTIMITVYDEMDNKVVNGIAMTQDTSEEPAGVYYYNFTPAADAILGDYKVVVNADLVVGGAPIIEHIGFGLGG